MLLNFKKQFVEPIRLGTKHHTIRGVRKDGYVPKPGEPLYLYCGARTKHCFKILEEPVKCTRVEKIKLIELGGFWITLNGVDLDDYESERLARADGFTDLAAMQDFWEGRLPFKGNIIHWR